MFLSFCCLQKNFVNSHLVFLFTGIVSTKTNFYFVNSHLVLLFTGIVSTKILDFVMNKQIDQK